MNRPEKIEQNKKKKTPTPVISGYTKEEMEEIYSFAQSKIGEKPSAELSEQPRIDFKINDRAVQHKGKGFRVKIDPSRDSLLTDFGRETLEDRYLMKGESFQELFARVASYYGDDDLGIDVLKQKYLAPWERHPYELWQRQAKALASVEKTKSLRTKMEKELLHMIEDLRFVPG